MSFAESGFAHFPRAFDPEKLALLVTRFDEGRAGKRIADGAQLSHWLDGSAEVGAVLDALGCHGARPVRAILFDKSPETNWALGWHQDRTICVRQRIEVEGYGPWTVKSGLAHVEPPFAVIERMVTLRFHLDPVGDDNAPLLVAEGSHRLGKLTVEEIDDVVTDCLPRACHAAAGDVWAYATPILHASERRRAATRRRVLQVDFSADELAGDLEWYGV